MSESDHEIEMYDDPWTWEGVLGTLYRVVVIVTACATLGTVMGYVAGKI